MSEEKETFANVLNELRFDIVHDAEWFYARLKEAHEREMAEKVARIALLEKALKPVMKLDMSDETKFTQTQLMLAVNEAKRIILEAWDDKNYFWKEDEK